MRLKYFVLTLSVTVLLSLAFTWQQVEIIKLAYQENRKTKNYKDLLDKNYSLNYALTSLKSSHNLGGKLFSGDTEFEIPKSSQMRVMVVPREEGNVIKTRDVFIKDGVILSMFKIKEAWPVSVLRAYIDRQAQAQDIIK